MKKYLYKLINFKNLSLPFVHTTDWLISSLFTVTIHNIPIKPRATSLWTKNYTAQCSFRPMMHFMQCPENFHKIIYQAK